MLWCPPDRMITPLSACKAALCFLSLRYCLCDALFCPFFASVLLRWLRCCSNVWQPSHFWGIPWVWRGASIRFSPNLFKPSGLNGRQSVRRGDGSGQRWRIWVSQGKQPSCMTRLCLVSSAFT